MSRQLINTNTEGINIKSDLRWIDYLDLIKLRMSCSVLDWWLRRHLFYENWMGEMWGKVKLYKNLHRPFCFFIFFILAYIMLASTTVVFAVNFHKFVLKYFELNLKANIIYVKIKTPQEFKYQYITLYFWIFEGSHIELAVWYF